MLISVRAGSRIFKVKKCTGFSSLKGLMFDDLDGHDGALIQADSIWMPFIKKDLNLIFLDENMQVIRNEIAPPLSLDPKSWKTYTEYRAKYCLELKHTNFKVKPGTRIKIL